MSYFTEIEQYVTYDGFVTFPKLGERNDNPFIGNATDLFIRNHILRSNTSVENAEKYRDAYMRSLSFLTHRRTLSSTWLPSTAPTWSSPGQSHDDINALLCHGHEYASYLYNGGRQRLWIFNSEGTLKGWFKGTYLRMGYLVPAIIAATKEGNGYKKVPWLLQKWYAWDLKQVSKLPVGETSTRCLILLQSQYANIFPPIMKDAMLKFLAVSQEQYGDVSGLYKIYFGEEHPFAKYTKGLKF